MFVCLLVTNYRPFCVQCPGCLLHGGVCICWARRKIPEILRSALAVVRAVTGGWGAVSVVMLAVLLWCCPAIADGMGGQCPPSCFPQWAFATTSAGTSEHHNSRRCTKALQNKLRALVDELRPVQRTSLLPLCLNGNRRILWGLTKQPHKRLSWCCAELQFAEPRPQFKGRLKGPMRKELEHKMRKMRARPATDEWRMLRLIVIGSVILVAFVSVLLGNTWFTAANQQVHNVQHVQQQNYQHQPLPLPNQNRFPQKLSCDQTPHLRCG